MYILYDPNSYNVIDKAEYIKVDGEYFVVCKNGLNVKYHSRGLDVIVLADQDVTCKDGAPLVLDLEKGSVYPDPLYVEEKNEDVSSVDTESVAGKKPMTVAEMRTKIKELENQFTIANSILDTIAKKIGIKLDIPE